MNTTDTAATPLPRTRADLEHELEAVGNRVAEIQAERNEFLATNRRLIDENRSVTQENDALRDQLHSLTIENARLSGYRERVREFDPVTEREAYQDERLHHAGSRGFAADGYGETQGGLVAYGSPWYRRRRA